jgi:hypothetical protein
MPRRKSVEIQVPALVPYTDVYYPDGWVPDFWRLREWQREFSDFEARRSLPSLTVMHIFGDHLGNFSKSLDGVDTPETQMADNDYAVGKLIEKVAGSSFGKDTLVVTIEDDASDGPDHVDADRAIALFAGPYVRRHAVVSTRYTSVNVVKTIEEILGIGPFDLNDALAAPMSDLFDPELAEWSYRAVVPDVLRSTRLPLPPSAHATVARPARPASYWKKAMASEEFTSFDAISFIRLIGRSGAE